MTNINEAATNTSTIVNRSLRRLARVLTLTTAVSATLVIRMATHDRTRVTKNLEVVEDTEVPNWRLLAKDGRVIGSPSAPVSMVVFTDFECPDCARAAELQHHVLREHSRTVKVIIRHFPRNGHIYAAKAAAAAECAGRQGKFASYADSLFARQAELASVSWEGLAREVGVGDAAMFKACLTDNVPGIQIATDMNLGTRFRVDATPTIFVNGYRYHGGGPDEIDLLVKRATDPPPWWKFWTLT